MVDGLFAGRLPLRYDDQYHWGRRRPDMRIAIIGAGRVGSSMAAGWTRAGHELRFGVRDPQSSSVQQAMSKLDHTIPVGTMQEAVQFAEVVVIAVPFAAVRYTLPELGDLGGRIVIDATNNFGPASTIETDSAAGDVAKHAQNARVVKCFNTMGFETMADPVIGSEAITAFVASDDADARRTVMGLARDLGMDAVDAGSLANAVHLESLTKLWASLTQTYGRRMGFRLLR
jgi:8-hydroxy-5-deazaflavin:NADPH oxidoreductase